MGIGNRIKEARENKGLTQTELGHLIGVTGSAITNYEKEVSHPKEAILYKLLDILEVDPNFLFQDVCKTNPEDFKTFEKLEKIYYSLNSAGKCMLIDFGEILFGNPKYKKEV